MKNLEQILKGYKSEDIAKLLAKRGHRIFLDDVNYTIKIEQPTEKQFKFIEKITEQLGVVFEGETLTDAAEFIKENIVFLDKIPTIKQLRLISVIEDNLNIKFDGKTMKEASDFIKKHIDKIKNTRRKSHSDYRYSGGDYHDLDPHWGFLSPYDFEEPF